MLKKVSDLTGAELDYAVALAEGCVYGLPGTIHAFSPSTKWSHGGPIIEREEIGIKRKAPCSQGRQWEASPSITAKGAGGHYGYGPTPLIAAMRCYVASRLGDTVEIPDEIGAKQ